MKKRMIPAIMCLMLLLSVPAQAAATRAVKAEPMLSFSGTTAICEVDLRSGNSSDRLAVTLTLKQGSTTLKSWSSSGTGRVTMSETANVKRGGSYTLVMSYTLNGVTQPSVSKSGTCK